MEIFWKSPMALTCVTIFIFNIKQALWCHYDFVSAFRLVYSTTKFSRYDFSRSGVCAFRDTDAKKYIDCSRCCNLSSLCQQFTTERTRWLVSIDIQSGIKHWHGDVLATCSEAKCNIWVAFSVIWRTMLRWIMKHLWFKSQQSVFASTARNETVQTIIHYHGC